MCYNNNSFQGEHNDVVDLKKVNGSIKPEVIDLTTSPMKSSTKTWHSVDSMADSDDEMFSRLPDSESEEEEYKKDVDDFYFNNPKWPVWSRNSEGLPCEELIKLILQDSAKQPTSICKSRPVAVRHNAVFVVDLDSVPLKNLTADDNGSWSISTPRRMYQVKHSNTGNILSIKKTDTVSSDTYTLFRQYATHKATKREKDVEFKRVVATIKNMSTGHVLPIAVLHYFFKDCPEQDIVLAPHGNARGTCKRPYMRTEPSTLQSIKEDCHNKKPKKLYGETFKSSGGLLESGSTSTEPRNRKQVYNARSNTRTDSGEKDEIFQLLTQLKDDYAGEGGFVQEVKFGKTPEVVVSFEQQLDDLVRFCCNPKQFSVLGIDPTFSLGKFFVTVTTYKHLMLRKKSTNAHPVFIGPCFIHMQQETQTYYSFLSCLRGKKDALRDLKAYGSDGEVSLLNALIAAFPDAIGLRCFIHMKDNIENHLQNKLHVKAEVKSAIIHDIFGHVVGDTKVGIICSFILLYGSHTLTIYPQPLLVPAIQLPLENNKPPGS